MMRPQLRLFIDGTARRIVWKAALRLMAITRSQSCAENSSTIDTCCTPALLTVRECACVWARASERACAILRVRTQNIDAPELLDRKVNERLGFRRRRQIGLLVVYLDAKRALQLRQQRFDSVGAARAVQNQRATDASEATGDAETDSLRRTSDESHLSGERSASHFDGSREREIDRESALIVR